MAKPLRAVLSLSGGMDSSALLVHLLARGYEVKVLSFDYGQKHKIELERATELIAYLKSRGYTRKILSHTIVDLSTLQPLLNSALVDGGVDVPEGHYEQDNMKATVVPNRNKIFASIIQSIALSWANEVDAEVKIALGIHAGDHAIYPDCRQEFRDADYQAFLVGNWGGEKVSYYTPFLKMDKYGILVDAAENCKTPVRFDEVFRRTNTSYKPIKIGEVTYSDYKSASSVERVEAFIKFGSADPVKYADESGPVTWDTVKTYVTKILTQPV